MLNAPTVSVVIPTLNEARNLPYVLPLIPEWVHEVIVVDGRSTDGTREVAREILPNVRIVEQPARGKGAALRTGLQAARGDIVVMLDADGSTDPNEIQTFVEALMSGADFAKGSRFLPGGGTSDMTWHRKFGNAMFVRMVRIRFGGKYTDLCYGYNAVWRRNVDELSLDCNGFEIETLINIRVLKARLRVAEVPSFEHPRIHGNSNLNAFRDGWRVLNTILREAVNGRPQVPSSRSLNVPAMNLIAVPIEPEGPFTITARDLQEVHEEFAAVEPG